VQRDAAADADAAERRFRKEEEGKEAIRSVSCRTSLLLLLLKEKNKQTNIPPRQRRRLRLRLKG